MLSFAVLTKIYFYLEKQSWAGERLHKLAGAGLVACNDVLASTAGSFSGAVSANSPCAVKTALNWRNSDLLHRLSSGLGSITTWTPPNTSSSEKEGDPEGAAEQQQDASQARNDQQSELQPPPLEGCAEPQQPLSETTKQERERRSPPLCLSPIAPAEEGEYDDHPTDVTLDAEELQELERAIDELQRQRREEWRFRGRMPARSPARPRSARVRKKRKDSLPSASPSPPPSSLSCPNILEELRAATTSPFAPREAAVAPPVPARRRITQNQRKIRRWIRNVEHGF